MGTGMRAAETVTNIASRLPVLNAALVLLGLDLECNRAMLGGAWCRDKGVGWRRRKLGRAATVPDSVDPLEKARDEARVLLSEMCRVCPNNCIMKDW